MAKNKDNLETINLEELTDLKEVEEALNNENENLEIYSKLRIPKKLRSSFSGDIIELEEGYVKTQFEATDEMVFDEEGVIHEGFIFGAANFAVKAAINDPNVVLVTSNIKFLAPIEMGNTVEFEAKVVHKYARKREVNVVGTVSDVKVFEGLFLTVILDQHILSLKLIREREDDHHLVVK